MSTQKKVNWFQKNFHIVLIAIFVLLCFNTCSNMLGFGNGQVQRTIDDRLDKIESQMVTDEEFQMQLELFFRAEEMSDKNKIPFEEQLGRLRMSDNK